MTIELTGRGTFGLATQQFFLINFFNIRNVNKLADEGTSASQGVVHVYTRKFFSAFF